MKRYLSLAWNKYKALPIPVRASLFFVFCGVLKDAVDIISTPIFTRLLTTTEYGLFNVYNSWYQILRIIVTLNLFGETFNVGLAKFGDDTKRYASSQQGMTVTMVAFWSAAAVIFRTALTGFTGLDFGFIVLMLLQAWFTAAYYIWFQQKRYTYSYKILTAVTVVYTILQPLLGIIAVKVNRFGYDNGELRIFTGVGVQIAFGLVFFVIQFIKSRTFFNKKYWNFSFKMNVPLLPHNLSQILLNQSDKLMIDAFNGKSYTAIYSVSHSAAFVIQAVTNNLNASLIPWMYEKLKKKDYDNIKKTVTSLVALAAVIVLMLVLVAPEAMKILASDEYHDGIWIIPPLAFSVFLIFLYMLFSDVEMFYEKSGYILISSIIGAGSNIALNALLIPKFGYLAAGYTTVAGYLLMLTGHIIFTKITCKKENVPFKELYDLKALLIITVILFAACAGIMTIYNYALIRYLLIAAVAAILFIKRKTLINLITSLKKKNES